MGRVDYVAAIVDTATRATGVRVVVQNRHEILKRDMYVRVAIESLQAATGTAGPGRVGAAGRGEPAVRLRRRAGWRIRPAPDHAGLAGRRRNMKSRRGLKAGDSVVSEGGLFIQFAESQ